MEPERDDNYLIDSFLAGDEYSFTLLVNKYKNHVINIAYSLIRETHYAEDIAQEVFINVYKNLKYFKKQAKFFTWLYRITLNTSYNHLKSKRKYVALEYIPDSGDTKKVSLENLDSKERRGLINKAIESLPVKYRSVIVLKEIEGLSYIDIAKTLGCRIGTVESRLFRARAMLRRALLPLLGGEKT